MSKNPVSIVIGVVLLAVFIMLLFVFQVRQSEVAIVTTFSKPSGTTLGPGPHGRLPWPIQKVYKFDQRVQAYEGKLIESQTSDNNNLLLQIYCGWRISDPTQYFLKFGDSAPEKGEERLNEMLQSAQKAAQGKHPMSDFVSADGSKFGAIEEQILAALQAQLKVNNYGMEVQFVGIKRLGLPDAVTQSVFDRMKSERAVLSSDYESKGQAEADKIRAKANSDAAKKLASAESEATRIRAEGQKAAAAVYPTFQQAPELANFLLRLDALEASAKDRTTLIFDANTPPFDLLRGGSITNLLKK
jgi:modulator of FtsH protease HflC